MTAEALCLVETYPLTPSERTILIGNRAIEITTSSIWEEYVQLYGGTMPRSAEELETIAAKIKQLEATLRKSPNQAIRDEVELLQIAYLAGAAYTSNFTPCDNIPGEPEAFDFTAIYR